MLAGIHEDASQPRLDLSNPPHAQQSCRNEPQLARFESERFYVFLASFFFHKTPKTHHRLLLLLEGYQDFINTNVGASLNQHLLHLAIALCTEHVLHLHRFHNRHLLRIHESVRLQQPPAAPAAKRVTHLSSDHLVALLDPQ